MEFGRIERGRLMIVNEMGNHTSFGPAYVNAPAGELAFLEIAGNARIHHHRGTLRGSSGGITGGKGCPYM
jgi:hypothetical protein